MHLPKGAERGQGRAGPEFRPPDPTAGALSTGKGESQLLMTEGRGHCALPLGGQISSWSEQQQLYSLRLPRGTPLQTKSR